MHNIVTIPSVQQERVHDTWVTEYFGIVHSVRSNKTNIIIDNILTRRFEWTLHVELADRFSHQTDTDVTVCEVARGVYLLKGTDT